MRKEFILKEAKFIATKDELGYQEILDDMEDAEFINIVTFNISAKQTYLLNCLKKASEDAEIRIITNIPSRWDVYYKENYKDIAKKKINTYMTKLKPEEIGNKASVFFNFDNHGKIIMTNKKAYIGSSNFSEESEHNIEFGFIAEDEDFIRYLNETLLPEISEKSLEYYEYDYMPLVLELNMTMSTLFSLKNELYNRIYTYYDDYQGAGYYYNTDSDSLDWNLLEGISKIIESLLETLESVEEALEIVSNGDVDVLNRFDKYRDDIFKRSEEYVELIECEIIYNLAEFNYSDCVNDILSDKYLMFAYEENLEEYVEKASDEASSILRELCESAEEHLESVLKIIDKQNKSLGKCIEHFSKYDLVRVNSNIDNTQWNNHKN